tara:strand:+ start:5530 stop:6723 length:1194 start_codon:yes stop_codon:yes gene_type:complete
MKIYIYFLALFYISTLHADDCSPRLGGLPSSSKERSLLENMPNMDQGTFGICYAHSAAFLYDHYRFSVQGQSMASGISSPLEVALSTREKATYEDAQKTYSGGSLDYHSGVGKKIQAGKKISMDDFVGGGAEDPLGYLVRNGSCNAFIIDQLNSTETYRRAMVNLRKYYYEFQDYLKEYEAKDKGLFESVFWDSGSYYEAKERYLNPIKMCLDSTLGVWTSQYLDDEFIIELLHQASPVQFVNDLVYARCNQERVKLNYFSSTPDVVTDRLRIDKNKSPPWMEGPEHIIKNVDDALDSNPSMPIEIAHCSKVYSRSFRTRRVHPGNTTNDMWQQCGPHSAVVAGRKKINNKCYYLVINWNGGECVEKANAICDEGTGGYWITKQDLGNATWQTTRLK